MTTVGHPKPVASYEHFFGLNEAPFSLAPNPQFMFESATHASALEQVAYALERREPLVVITGEIGAGKTLLCRTVLQRLQRKTFVSVIHDPQLGRDDLLKQLLEDFGVISKDRTRLTPTSRHDLFHALQDFLASLVPLQAHAVVIIDEAQHLTPDVLEQIRLLSNIDDERGTLLQMILVGQTNLEPVLSRPELRQFQQRVSRRFRLEPLSADEVKQYIEHRLGVARGGPPRSQLPGAADLDIEVTLWATAKTSVTFMPDAIQAVAGLSGGLPRVINIVCDRALEAAYAQRTRTIDLELINTAARALGMPVQPAAIVAAPQAPAAAPDIAAPPEPARHLDFFPQVKSVDAAAASEPRGRPDTPVRQVPIAFGALIQKDVPAVPRKWVMAAALLLLAAVVIWFGVRAMNAPATPPVTAPVAPGPRSSAAAPPSPAVASSAPADPASASAGPTAATPEARTTAPSAGTAAITDGPFEIVVASFKTEERATIAAAGVAALGLPARRRVADGWQQVLTGPFASRAEAVAAQQRLDSAGLTGSRVAPMSR